MILPEIQKWSDEETNLSRRMILSWSSFAKTGSPGWPQFDAKDMVIKNFDTEDSISSGNDEHFQERLNYIKQIYSQ